MKKKNRAVQQAATSGRTSDVTPPAYPIQSLKRTPKKHRARVYMLRTGVEGWTENDILRYCRLSSGRNYATELIRLLDISLERIQERKTDLKLAARTSSRTSTTFSSKNGQILVLPGLHQVLIIAKPAALISIPSLLIVILGLQMRLRKVSTIRLGALQQISRFQAQ